MNEIDGKGRTIRELLGKKFSVDFYQREYKWQTKQVRELLDDLAESFLAHYKQNDERNAVQKYGHYFLGSVILSNDDKKKKTFVIDGQQRLTTLTLLLIYLLRRQGDKPDRVKLDDLIYSEKYGTKSFNLDVPERKACMEALFTGQHFDPNGQPESVQNIIARYQDIDAVFPKEIGESALPYFADWLIENVNLVEISATSDEDAYTIFETMNDRGLSLSPLDMLKGYLLANITDDEKRAAANQLWKVRVQELVELGKEEDADAVKAWLRSQYAQSIRERKKGAHPGDFDRLGTEFHRWVKEQEKKIGLHKSDDFARFIQHDMNFYGQQFHRVRHASLKLTPGLEAVYYNAQNDFTLQYPLLLAPLLPDDPEDVVTHKLRIVAEFLDILIARRAVNYLSLNYSAMSYNVFLIMKDIRAKNVDELVTVLTDRLLNLGCDFNGTSDGSRKGVQDFRLNQWSKRYIHQMLARMTAFVEVQSGLPNHFVEYVAEGKNRYEIEHIWANHPEHHAEEIPDASDFDNWRNSIGGLLLLPKSFNASYGDLPYAEKLEHYNGQNLLARSLHQNCYDHDPGFLKFVQQSGLPFKPLPQFKKDDLEARQQLYHKVAEAIWNPKRLQVAVQ
ncbi:MAG TPA: DUF262 domain-containing protein [Verrucomicrobiota bacterium]|nr:DUF262 domain-containing protein [Verrucomicrobiota bacterium]HQL79287.1 DUF262 domain-containing protein [Verrucomicrobiota bacterium]